MAAAFLVDMPAVLLSISMVLNFILPAIPLYLAICSFYNDWMPLITQFSPLVINFTMGPKDAAIAAEFLQAEYVIPIHYNTWPLIAQDPVKFKEAVEKSTKSKVLIVAPGENIELK